MTTVGSSRVEVPCRKFEQITPDGSTGLRHAHAILVGDDGLDAAADPRADGVAVGLD